MLAPGQEARDPLFSRANAPGHERSREVVFNEGAIGVANVVNNLWRNIGRVKVER